MGDHRFGVWGTRCFSAGGVFLWNSVARTILQAHTNSACCTDDITNSLADNILAGELAGLDVKHDIYPDT